MYSIVIPTIKSKEEIQSQKQEIEKYLKGDAELIYVMKQQSASKNRNECIDAAKYDIVIMVDDDITGFFENWYKILPEKLVTEPEKVSIVSARLLNKDGSIGAMLGDNSDKTLYGDYQIAKHTDKTGLQLVCSACIAFNKKDGVRFDERYETAVFEDTDMCMEYRKKYPEKNIIINNRVKLIHANEMKKLNGRRCVGENRKKFNEKWGLSL